MQDITAYVGYINDCIPEIGASSLRLLAAGADWIVAQLDDTRLLRLPRHADAKEVFGKEVAILEGLHAARLPVPVPQVLQSWPGDRERPIPFVIMTRVAGTPVSKTSEVSTHGAFAESLASMLTKLHSFPAEDLLHIDFNVVSKSQWCELGPQVFVESLDSIADLLRPGIEAEVRSAIERTFNLAAHSPFAAVLLHGDLTEDNLLVDPDTRQVTGVIDFGDAQIGDPAFDFRTLIECFGEKQSGAVFSHYASTHVDADETFWQRALLYARLRPLEGLFGSGSTKTSPERVCTTLTARWR